VTVRLPLFPLGTVLFPGLLLPLHVFEERYRVLIRELLERPENDRRFGVIAIRRGHEVGTDRVEALHPVGCTAELRRVQPYDDGRFDILTSGVARFRVVGLDASAPYLTGSVEILGETGGDVGELPLLAPAVQEAFTDYLAALASAQGSDIEVPDVPADPVLLSYLVAATVVVDLADKQALLEAPTAVERLQGELALLRRETGLLRRLSAAPATDLTRSAAYPN